jgi:DNA mismatch repair protein MutL
MAKILQLDPHVADLIAAGEVVERPGSVIKELMEKAIDAGATVITVEIMGGGMTFMRVTDNGCGMAADDAETAFLRHATSKLRDERGWRPSDARIPGEALAAIAAVSKIELLTRETGAGEGTGLALDGGAVVSKEPAGCPEGTTIIVRDLFYNTPARLKFMKTNRAEGAAVSAVVIRCALSHPEVSVRYLKDGKEECHTPGDGRMDSCIYSLFGRDFAKDLLAAETSDADVSVSGFVTAPVQAKGNRNHQYFFVNGRFVKSKLLQAALEQAYRNALLAGRFPASILYLTVKANAVDVNVHPTKTEVKFLYERQVFDGVYYAVRAALGGETKRAEIHLSDGTEALRSNAVSPDRPAGPAPFRPERPRQPGAGGFRTPSFRSTVPPVGEKALYSPVRDESLTPYQTKLDAQDVPENQVHSASPGDAPYRIIGEALGTYIIVEQGETLLLIDKHAAHERIHFDRLKDEKTPIMTQQLLTPVVCDLDREDAALLAEHAALLEELGFEIESFGDTSVVVRQAPSDMDVDDAGAFLGELCEDLRSGSKMNPEDVRDELIHTIACKMAIKAGKRSRLPELETLVERVLGGEIRYCPHGRPIAIELTKNTLDKYFRRT